MGTAFPEPKDDFSPHDREWLRRIEESRVEFKAVHLPTFIGTINCRSIENKPTNKETGPARQLFVKGNTIYRFYNGAVSMMLSGEFVHVGDVNHNGRIIRASKKLGVDLFDPINIPDRPHTLIQYHISASPVTKSEESDSEAGE